MSVPEHYRQRTASEIVDASFQLYRANFWLLLTIGVLATVPPAMASLFVPVTVSGYVTFAGGLLLPLAHGAIAVWVLAGATQHIDMRVTLLVTTVISALCLPPLAVSRALLYVDLRVRAEGLDIEAMSAALPSNTQAEFR